MDGISVWRDKSRTDLRARKFEASANSLFTRKEYLLSAQLE